MERYALFFLVLLVNSAGAQFGPPAPIELTDARDPSSVQLHDLDNDGDLDVLFSTYLTEGLGWYENLGSSTFAPVRHFPTTGWQKSATALDVDGDGLLDVIGKTQAGLVYFRNLNNRLFSEPELVAGPGWGTEHIMSADVDGDGLDDLLSIGGVGGNSKVSWSRRLPEGGMGPRTTISTDLNGPKRMHLADVNGDSSLDLFVTATDNVWLFLNQGDGYGPQTSVWWTVEADYHTVTTMDVNDDGHLDLVFGENSSNAGVAWRLNDGNGSFNGTSNGGMPGDHIASTAVIDANGDGLDDLVATPNAQGRVTVYHNNGNNTFAPAVALANNVDGANDLAIGDVDGDAVEDIVYIGQNDNDIGWLRGIPGGGHEPPVLINPQSVNPFTMVMTDLTGDNLDDLVVFSQDDRIAYYAATGPGVYSEQILVTQDVKSLQSGIVEDMDGDGDRDIVYRTSGSPPLRLMIHRNNGTGVSGTVPEVLWESTGILPQRFTAEDWDGDGDIDLLFPWTGGLELLVNDGSGTMVQMNSIVAPASDDVYPVDLDNDGLMDIVTRSEFYDRISWLRGLGGGTFAGDSVISGSVDLPLELAFGDMDGNGLMDIISISGGTSSVHYIRQTAMGTFDEPVLLMDGLQAPRSLICEDLDGDGDQDVLFSNSTANSVLALLNSGTGTFGSPMIVNEGHYRPWKLVVADVDGDARKDIVSASATGIYWLKGYFNSPYSISGEVYHDADGDGVRDPGEGSLPWVQINSAPVTTSPMTSPSGAYSIPVDQGSYSIQCHLPDFWTVVGGASSQDVVITESGPLAEDVDFPVVAEADTSLIVPAITWGAAPCGGQNNLWISVGNQGTRIEQGTITLQLDTPFTFIASIPPPDLVQGLEFIWNFDDLGFFDIRNIEMTVTMPGIESMTDTVSNILTVATLDAGGNNLESFQYTDMWRVDCAYDPNDKQVFPEGHGPHGAVSIATEHLDYTIRFQNTGTAPAFDVVLYDQLPAEAVAHSLQVIGHSHMAPEVEVEPNGRLKVSFIEIMLPDSNVSFTGSQGFVSFRVALQGSLPHLTTIENCAGIHFDLNPPIITNTTLTTLVDCGLWSPELIMMDGYLIASTGDSYEWYLDGELLMEDTVGPSLMIEANGIYQVAVTDVFGCTAFTDPYQVITTDVAISKHQHAYAVPNPFTTVTRLMFHEPLTKEHTILITDLQGRLIRTMEEPGQRQLEITRQGLTAGVYVVRITNEGQNVGSLLLVVE